MLHQGAAAAQLYQLPQIHDSHPVRQVGDHVQVVGDKQIGQPQFPAKLQQQVEHLGLHGHIQGGHRLVADHKLRMQHQGDGDGHPLALAPGKFPRQPVPVGFVQAHSPQHVQRPLPPLLAAFPPFVNLQRLLHQPPNGLQRVNGGVGVLKDDLHAPAEGLSLPRAGPCHVPAAEQHLPLRGLQQPHQHLPQGGLAAAGLPHQPKHLPGKDIQAQGAHRAHPFPALAELFGKAPQLHQRGGSFLPDRVSLGLGHGFIASFASTQRAPWVPRTAKGRGFFWQTSRRRGHRS